MKDRTIKTSNRSTKVNREEVREAIKETRRNKENIDRFRVLTVLSYEFLAEELNKLKPNEKVRGVTSFKRECPIYGRFTGRVETVIFVVIETVF